MQILKYWKVLLLLLFVIGSLYLIVPVDKKGVAVKSIDSDSPFYGKLKAGEIITWMNEKEIASPEDLLQFENYTGVIRFIHSGKLELVDGKGGSLGIVVAKPDSSRLKLGLDLVGGTRVLLEPKGNVSSAELEQILGTLETRINVFGLKETKFQIVKDVSGSGYIQVEVAGGTEGDVKDLLAKQGKFEGKIFRTVDIAKGNGTLKFGTKTYTIKATNSSIELEGSMIGMNESSMLDGVPFVLQNITEGKAFLLFTTFTGDDIRTVCIVDQPNVCVSRVFSEGSFWQFNFQVFLSQKGADNFAKVTSGLGISPASPSYLESPLQLYLDEKSITTLSIAADLAGKALTEPSITGGENTKEEALKEKIFLQSILQSGALPVGLEIVKSDTISPVLGRNFISSSVFAGLLAILAVGIVVFIRYRSIKLTIPVMLTGLSEVIVILGGAAMIGWTLDLVAIAAIIAVVGTGIDAQIMILDETLGGIKGEAYTVRQKIKSAFFIIFSSAATVIAAMLPLLFIGIGAMKGFAIVTMMGVLIGVLITRPAFGTVIEKLLEDKS
ncbi:MAG TPA: hypothetical protein VJH90_00930 [archaeon]|nr:hypothetical protein [archaeon]